jgi:SPP1 gp7 family putative phage head morphogenesis protein
LIGVGLVAEVPATNEDPKDDKQLPEEELPEGEKPRPIGAAAKKLAPDVYFGTAEKTSQESAWVADSLYKPYNPDDLYAKTSDYSIYEDMEVDDQVAIAMQLKRDLVIGSGWSIVTESEDQQEAADAIYCDLEEEPDVAFDDLLEEMIDVAYTKGFALTEKLFKIKDDGSLALKNLKTRYPNSWLIHTDHQGNIEKYEQHTVKGAIKVDPKSLIHFINQPRHQNPYGKSDLRAAYEAWMVKRHIVRFYAIFLEKAAGPIPVAKYEKSVPNARVQEVHNAIKNFQAKTAITLPKDFDIEFLEAKGNGEAYVKGINLFNMFIGRALTIPDLLGFQGGETGGGSLSLGQSQISVFYKHIARRRKALERIINKHIIQPLCIWNFGITEDFPRFVLNPISDDKALDYAKTYLELVKGKIYKPTIQEINHFKDLIKFPLSDEDDIEWIGGANAINPLTGEPMGGGIDPVTGEPIPSEEQKNGEQEEGGTKEGTDEEKPKGQQPGDQEQVGAAKFTDLGHFAKAPTFGERVDFKALSNALDQKGMELLREAKPIIDDIFEDLFNQLMDKNILGEKPNPERIDTIKLKGLKKFQVLLKKILRKHYMEQKTRAAKEVKKDFAQPLPSDKFLDFLETETYQYVGDWEYMIRKKTKQQIINAIKDGKPISSVIGVLDNDGRELSDVSLERYSRTKLTEVMNRARVEAFEDSGIVAAYQYSAIMDSVTSDICAGLDGKIFEKGSEPIPPMHFNCRSVLVPITKFEKYTPDTKATNADGEEVNIDKFIDESIKDTGFSKR